MDCYALVKDEKGNTHYIPQNRVNEWRQKHRPTFAKRKPRQMPVGQTPPIIALPVKTAEMELGLPRLKPQKLAKTKKVATPRPKKVKISKAPVGLAKNKPIPINVTGRGGKTSTGGGLSNYNPGGSSDYSPSVRVPVQNPQRVSTWDKIFSIGSQIVSGYAPNPTIQTVGGQAPLYPVNQQPTGNYDNTDSPTQFQNNQNGSLGASLGGGLDGIVNWATANPLIVFGALGGIYLLFRQPPGKR